MRCHTGLRPLVAVVAPPGLACRGTRHAFCAPVSRGQRSCEANVPADAGLHVWQALQAAGAAQRVTACGTEAMHVLRAVKGFVIARQDTDGSVTPVDLGMAAVVGKTMTFWARGRCRAAITHAPSASSASFCQPAGAAA